MSGDNINIDPNNPFSVFVALIQPQFDKLNTRLDSMQVNDRELAVRMSRVEEGQKGGIRETEDLRENLKVTQDDLKQTRDEKAKLESRVTRLETIVVPGMSLIAAVASAAIGHFFK